MEIIVKKDILDEIQAQGLCHNSEEAKKILNMVLEEIATYLRTYPRLKLHDFGTFSIGRSTQDVYEIPTEEFLSKLVTTFSIEKNKSQQIVATLVHFIKEMLIKGHEVQIIDFANFRLEEQRVQIIKSPPKGQSSVLPARKVLVFEPEKSLCEKAGAQEIQFAPDEDFQKHIAHLKTSSLLLLVPKRDFFIQTFEYHFSRAGWQVDITSSVEEAKHLINASGTYLATLDSLVPDYQSICEIIKCNRETCLIPLIIMYPKGTDLKKANGFRICGDENLMQPFEIKQLIAFAESVLRKHVEEKATFKQELMLQFLTTDQYIDKANELCSKLFSISGISEEAQISMAAAFREALANAAQHGNKHRKDKLLEVLYLLDKEKIITAITDSGFGFDWRKYLRAGEKGDAVGRARQSHREGRLGGLGIMLMLRCVDKLEYNDTGNMLTLTKYLRSKSGIQKS